MTPRMMVFDGKLFQHLEIELRLRRFDRDLRSLRAFQFGQKRVAGRLVVHDGGVAEAQMHGDSAGHAIERAVERLQAIVARLLGMLLHPRLVDLHDVGAGREQVLDLRIDRFRIVERHGFVAD